MSSFYQNQFLTFFYICDYSQYQLLSIIELSHNCIMIEIVGDLWLESDYHKIMSIMWLLRDCLKLITLQMWLMENVCKDDIYIFET